MNGLPEGFAADPDGTYRGIPARNMLAANAVMCSITRDRQWDVPFIAQTLQRHEHFALLNLRHELMQPGWAGGDSGWDYAISQVCRRIRELTNT